MRAADRLDGAKLRHRDLKLRQDLQQIGFELLIRPVDLVESTAPVPRMPRSPPAMGGAARTAPRTHPPPPPQPGSRSTGADSSTHKSPGQHPIPHSMQPDQTGRLDAGQGLGDLGLAHPGGPLQQQGPPKGKRQMQAHGQRVRGNIAHPASRSCSALKLTPPVPKAPLPQRGRPGGGRARDGRQASRMRACPHAVWLGPAQPCRPRSWATFHSRQ